jgi:hypothetical protein
VEEPDAGTSGGLGTDRGGTAETAEIQDRLITIWISPASSPALLEDHARETWEGDTPPSPATAGASTGGNATAARDGRI